VIPRWQLDAGVGGITGEPLAHRPVLLGEIGRTLYARPRATLDLVFGAALITTASRVCLVAQQECDLRRLVDVEHLGVVATASLLASEATPYIRAGAGAWSGHDSGASAGRPSGEDGSMLSVEGGYRIERAELGLAVQLFDASIRGTVHVVSFVVRARF
jgi:hypothetical protein